MKVLVLSGFAIAAITSFPALAQEGGAPEAQAIVAVAKPTASAGSALPANTEVLLTLNSELTSKKAREGDTFDLTVARDVMIGDFIVIPRGAPAHGVVTWRTGKGAFGKSAKMEIEMRSIEVDGRTIMISGSYRQEGGGNTGATVGTAVAAGPFAAFVTGRSAKWRQGSEFKAFTREAVPVVIPGI